MRPETVWLLIFLYISENRLNGFENGKTQLFDWHDWHVHEDVPGANVCSPYVLGARHVAYPRF